MINLTNKITTILFALATLTSCNIDESYDLSNVDSDNMGFGTDETSFMIPLFEITFTIPEESSEELSTKSDSYSFEFESIINAIEVGSDILDLIEKNIDGENNTISIVATTTTSLGDEINATPTLKYTDYNGIEQSLEVGNISTNNTEIGLIANIDTLRAILESVSISTSISIDGLGFSVEDLDPENKYIKMVFSAYKKGSLKL